MTTAAAFFDLDRTFIDCNSGLLYARWEYRRGNVSPLQFLRVLIWGIGYHFSLIDIDKAYREALTIYEGKPERDVNAWSCEWFAEMVASRAQPGALARLDQHKEADEPCVLLTNSSCYAAACAVDEWSFDAWIANRFPTDEDGNLTGEFEAPLCYGAGKVSRAERWARENDVSLDESYFYSDSYSDLPMLERVGHPVIVNPDPRLARIARKRGWPIEDWSRARLVNKGATKALTS